MWPSPLARSGRLHVRETTDGDLILRIGRRRPSRRSSSSTDATRARCSGSRCGGSATAARAEDAVQETFTSIWRSARSYRPERGPGAPWLYAVARNAIVDRARRAQRAARRDARRPADRARARPSSAEAAGCLARPPRARGAARARARGGLARLLERALAERDRGVPGHPARYREDTNPYRAGAARGCAREELQ